MLWNILGTLYLHVLLRPSSWQKRNIRRYKKGTLEIFLYQFKDLGSRLSNKGVFCFHEKTDISSIEANKNLYKPSKKEWNSSTEYQKPLENTSWGGSMRNMKTVKEAATLTEHWEAESRVENHVVVKNQLFTFIIPLPLECEPKMKVPEHVREV